MNLTNIIMVTDTPFKVGDRVQIRGESLRDGYFETKDFKGPLTVAGVYRRPWSGTRGGSHGPYLIWTDANGKEGHGMEPGHFELVKVTQPTEWQRFTKHWLIAVLDKNTHMPLPAAKPRTYSSAEQARRVAYEMAEKNRGESFVVYEATDVTVAPHVVLPATQSHKL